MLLASFSPLCLFPDRHTHTHPYNTIGVFVRAISSWGFKEAQVFPAAFSLSLSLSLDAFTPFFFFLLTPPQVAFFPPALDVGIFRISPTKSHLYRRKLFFFKTSHDDVEQR